MREPEGETQILFYFKIKKIKWTWKMLKTGFGQKWEEWSIIFLGEKNWPSIADQFNLKVVNKGKKKWKVGGPV